MSLHNVYRERLPRHSHNMSERRYFDMPMGVMVPFYCHELYPGDKVSISSRAFLETRTLNSPLKNGIRFREYWFFIPRRLMWKNWEKFIFGGKDGDYTAVPPYLTSPSSGNVVAKNHQYYGICSLYDYLGFPVVADGQKTLADVHDFMEKVKIDAMPFAAYQMIFKDWFRNENFSDDSWDFENNGQAWLKDGANTVIQGEDGVQITATAEVNGQNSLWALRHAPWSRTYFTAALPFRQRGTVNRVPLSGSAFLRAGVVRNGVVPDMQTAEIVANAVNSVVRDTGAAPSYVGDSVVPIEKIGGLASGVNISDGGGLYEQPSRPAWQYRDVSAPSSSPYTYFGINGADLQGFTITELRLLAKLQEFAEINARFGFRYLEGLRGHFGVSPTDARLDRPEFIGGMSQDVVVNEVLQTSETSSTPLGTPAGRGVSASGSRIGSYYAEEHGLLMGICSIMPEQIYSQGIPREFTRHTKEEFFSPEFNGLSEQEIREKEIYADASMSADDLDTVFGFVPSWEELRHGKTMVTGNLRNPSAADLFSWTMARYFTKKPTLGNSFLYGYQYSDYGSSELPTLENDGGIRTDAWTTGRLANPFFVSIASRVRKISTVSASGVPGITRI